MASTKNLIPPTEKQTTFVKKLLEELRGNEEAERVRIALNVLAKTGNLSKQVVSGSISALIEIKRTSPPASDAAIAHELDDGIYEKDSSFILVYHTVHGANHQVAKLLVISGNAEEGFQGEWEYLGKRGLRGLGPQHKLDEDAARKFGEVYGICVRCARKLTKDESKHVGYGKTCAGHEGWWYPTRSELRTLTATAS